MWFSRADHIGKSQGKGVKEEEEQQGRGWQEDEK